jgi:RNA polymerase sigma-70 factor (ECF subfamily)
MLETTQYDEKRLLLLISQDSNYAFQFIYDLHKDNIYRVAILILNSPILAEEVVQDVFLKLWFERKNLNELQSLENWLFIVARNHCLKQLKKIASEWKNIGGYSASENELFEEHPENGLDKNIYKSIHKNAVSQLTEHQKKVYELVKLQNLSHQEVATKLKISPLTVNKHLVRALKSIRKYLKEAGFNLFSTFF